MHKSSVLLMNNPAPHPVANPPQIDAEAAYNGLEELKNLNKDSNRTMFMKILVP